MNSYRKTGIIVGVLFIVATVTSILSLLFLGSTLDTLNLTTISLNQNQMIIAVIFELIVAVSVFSIGFMMFSILKKYSESLALSYVGIRLIEAVFILIASLSLISLLTISQQYVVGSLDSTIPGSLLLVLRDWSLVIGTLIFLGLGGLSLNYILYQSKLIPRWLSAWGLIGAAMVLLYGLLSLFSFSTDLMLTLNLLAAPIALQEMVFAVWLIVKGFNPSAIDSGSVK
ncbi:MAG: DUF4386 domain-containing protein [Candidatus Subteraquimicrobiales bacterium]|nr:DUF4386 domain-containing protein [Candidatus Subteraquimicrobiales bacterium]